MTALDHGVEFLDVDTNDENGVVLATAGGLNFGICSLRTSDGAWSVEHVHFIDEHGKAGPPVNVNDPAVQANSDLVRAIRAIVEDDHRARKQAQR